jgi:hypothetical protein
MSINGLSCSGGVLGTDASDFGLPGAESSTTAFFAPQAENIMAKKTQIIRAAKQTVLAFLSE